MNMIDLLNDQLLEYKMQYEEIEPECLRLMEEGKEWKELAKKAAGLKMMVDHCVSEINRLKNMEEEK